MMGLVARRMQVAKDSRRSREAARAVSVYLGSARSTALANRRPCGVMLASAGTAGGMQNCVMVLEQAEVPAPYAGDTTAATATVQVAAALTYAANMSSGASTRNIVHTGDQIQFNYEGPWYTINSVSGSQFVAHDERYELRPDRAVAGHHGPRECRGSRTASTASRTHQRDQAGRSPSRCNCPPARSST